MPPQVFKSALFLVAKCPSDNVNNFVEIEKIFIFGENYHMSEQNFLIFEKNYDISGKI